MAPFFLLATLAFWAYRGEAQPGTVKNISPGVWFRQGEQAAMGHCNNIFIEMNTEESGRGGRHPLHANADQGVAAGESQRRQKSENHR